MEQKDVILLVDDNPDDVLRLGLAFKKLRIHNPIRVLSHGLELVAYLEGEGKYADRGLDPLPQLILLDLNMPKMNGFQVLKWLRDEPDFKHVPVIVLAGSVYSADIKRAYELGANSFVTKTVDQDQFVSEVEDMLRYWLGITKLPEQRPTASGEGSSNEPIKLPSLDEPLGNQEAA